MKLILPNNEGMGARFGSIVGTRSRRRPQMCMGNQMSFLILAKASASRPVVEVSNNNNTQPLLCTMKLSSMIIWQLNFVETNVSMPEDMSKIRGSLLLGQRSLECRHRASEVRESVLLWLWRQSWLPHWKKAKYKRQNCKGCSSTGRVPYGSTMQNAITRPDKDSNKIDNVLKWPLSTVSVTSTAKYLRIKSR